MTPQERVVQRLMTVCNGVTGAIIPPKIAIT